MARLTIEQKWWIDPRRSALMGRIATPSMVEGAIIPAWIIGQEYWANQQLVPWRVFSKIPHAEDIIASDLAELRTGPEHNSTPLEHLPNTFEQRLNTFVYVRGSKDLFAWIADIREKRRRGGQISALKRKAKTGSAQPKARKPRTPAEHNPTQVNIPEVSGSGSGLGFDSGLGSGSGNLASGIENEILSEGESSKGPSATALTWRAYKAAYTERWGSSPKWNSSQAGKLKSFVARVPAADAPDIAAFYVGHNDAFYVKSMHPLGLLLRDAEKVCTEWETGRQMTSSRARDVDRKQTNLSAFQELIAEEESKRG